jgi:hypothetical protein
MPRIVRSALLLPALAAVALSTGCTTTVPGSATAQGASAPDAAGTGDPVAWVDQVCGSMLPFIRTATSAPNPEEAEDAAALIEDISSYLGEAGDAAGSALDGLDAAGPSPVEGGDEVVEQLNGTISAFQSSYQEAQSRIDSVDIDDREAVLREVPAAIRQLNQLASMPNPTAGLRGSPELREAGEQAASCQQIEREFRR